MAASLVAELSAGAIRHNLGVLRGLLTPATRLCAVVKADAYGHGLELLLPLLAGEVDALAVATHDEALALRAAGFDKEILVFFSPFALAEGRVLGELVRTLAERRVTLTVASAEEVRVVAEATAPLPGRPRVHLKIDTGMNRSGVRHASAPDLLRRLRRSARVELAGAYTHFATADEADKGFAGEQLARLLAAVEAGGGRDGLVLHAANTAAMLDLPESHLDMVRPGLAVFGYLPSDEIANPPRLRPALRLTAPLMEIKEVEPGERCGYGLTHLFERPGRLGLVPVGYADGYLRCLGNRAVMGLRGHQVPVRGRVAMDQVTVELTGVPAARVGDPVEIIAASPTAPHGVEGLARLAATIPYEITCRLGARVRRVLVE